MSFAIAVGAVCALAVLLGARPLLRRLPEPVLEDPSGEHSSPEDPKVPYAALAEWRFAAGCAILAGVACALGWGLSPAAARPLWLVLGTAGLLLAAIDARTTWLPLPLNRAAWALMAVAAAMAGPIGGWEVSLRAGVGAAVAGLLYLVIWVLSRGGFGFGDVRFAPLIGAAAAADSYSVLLWSLLLGSFVGAVHGLARLALRRRTPYAYAPAILAGAYLALVASATVRT